MMLGKLMPLVLLYISTHVYFYYLYSLTDIICPKSWVGNLQLRADHYFLQLIVHALYLTSKGLDLSIFFVFLVEYEGFDDFQEVTFLGSAQGLEPFSQLILVCVDSFADEVIPIFGMNSFEIEFVLDVLAAAGDIELIYGHLSHDGINIRG